MQNCGCSSEQWILRMEGHPTGRYRVAEGDRGQIGVFRSHRQLFLGRLVVGFGEPPVLFRRPNVKTHLIDAIASRKFDWRPYSTVDVDLVVIEVAAFPEFVGLVEKKEKGNVNRPWA